MFNELASLQSVTDDSDVSGQPSNDSSDIREVIDKWSFCIKPGKVFTDEHVENLAAIYSPQAVDIYPNQQSNIGMLNLHLRWEGFKGSDKVSKFLFPWAMVLTKEKDGQWRILVYHFYLG